MALRRPLLIGALLAAVVFQGAPAAQAEPDTTYEMPFPCGQTWTGSTRSSHSPSSRAVDWNRANDIYDPVVAAAAGTVTTADRTDNGGYGKYVVIDHGGGESTLYAHLYSVTVKTGQKLKQGDRVGSLGSSGNSTGPHLHFEERLNGRVQPAYFSGREFTYGSTLKSRNCPTTTPPKPTPPPVQDIPLAGDFTGDRRDETGVFRPTDPSSFQLRNRWGNTRVVAFGTPGDLPVMGNWDGYGAENPGVRNQATRVFKLKNPRTGIDTYTFGRTTDLPVGGNWDGRGGWEIGIWRGATHSFWLRMAPGELRLVRMGDSNDKPITGDWNGDGVTDVGVYDPTRSRFNLRILNSSGTSTWVNAVSFGQPGDLPIAGDWDGNGLDEVGVWRPSTATFYLREAPSMRDAQRSTTSFRYGTPR